MLAKLFLMFIKIGMVGYGGGYAILSLILAEGQKLVELTKNEFAALTALDLVVPGPIAINAATYVGYIKAGIPGAFIATIALMAPSYGYVLPATHFMDKFKDNKYLQGALSGIKPATIGLVGGAAFMIGQDSFYAGNMINYQCIGIFIAVLIAAIRFKLDPILMIVLSGAAGGLLLM